MADQQLTVSEFAAKIKAKYPEYKDIDDLELSRKIVDKYPEYESLVVFEDPKKKEETQEPFQFGVSDTELPSPSQETKEPAEEEAVDRSPTVGEWFGNIWNGLSEGVTDFLYPAAESTGLTDKNILSFVKQNQEEYPDLFEAYEKSLSNSAIQSNFTGEKAEELAARTAYSQYWESDPSIENKVVPFIRGERREEAVKKTGVEIPEDIKRSLDEQFWNSSLKGLASSLPAMVASSPTAGGSFVVQSYYSREEEIARTLSENPDLEMTGAQKEAYKITGALVEGALEKIGLSGALKGSPALTKLVTANVIDKALKGTKKVGKETLDRYINESVQEVGKRIAGGTLAEAETGALQQLSDDALKAVVNTAQGEEFFDPKSLANVFKDALYAGAQEAVGGGLISSVSTLGMSSNERKLKDIDSEIENLKQKREGAETEEEKTIIDDVITDLTEEQNKEREESFKLYSKFSEQDLIEVQSLNDQIREIASKYNVATSETLKEKYKKEVDDLRARKQELENKYSEEKVRYIKDGKEYSKGEFVDMINKATPEDIATGQWGVENDSEVEQLLLSKLPEDDSKKEERVPSTEQKEEAPVKAEPVAEPSKEEAPADRDVQKDEPETLVKNIEDNVIYYKDPISEKVIEGTLIKDGQRAVVETESKLMDIGNFDEIKDTPISELGIEVQMTPDVQIAGDKIVIRGAEYISDSKNIKDNFNLNNEGDIVSVSLETADGKKRTFRGAVAQEIAYQNWLQENASTPEQIAELELELIELIEQDEKAREILNETTTETKQLEAITEDVDTKEARTEEVEITLLEENGSVKPLTKAGPTTDPRNVQTGKMTIEYGDKGITFKTTEDTGRMKEEGGEIFVSNEQISKMPNIGKFEKNTKEYAQHVASMSGIADPKPEIDPIEGLMSRAVKVEDIGKEGTASAKRFTAKQGEQLTAMVNNFEKILKSSGARRVKVLFFNQSDSVAYRSYKTGKDSFASKGSYFDNTIVVNIDSADMSTLPHEMLHAYISSVKMDDKKIVQFTNAIENELNKGSDSERELAKELSAFRDRYIERKVYGEGKTKEDALIAEEFLAQYVGLLSTASENMPKAKQVSFIDKIRAAVVKFLSKIGIVDKNLVAKIKTREDALNFINGFVDALQGRVDPTAKPEVQVEEQGESGEVGTIDIPRQDIEVIDAPKASEDSRDFVREFVTDINIKDLKGKKFVTNMYDYTNAGLTQLGNGLSINLLGGRNYVPLMLKLNGKKLGEVSNLAAFNTKAQAEGFIRNAQEGKADLFAPHSGTLTDSWQFQHHIFEELVALVLDNKIMSKAKLMDTFNEAIKSKEGAKAFQAFNEKNKSRLKNLNSFKKDPMKLVELLNADNNYSPNLRKALNQKIASSKDFQQAIGIKNLNQFYNLIADPLNEGVSGGEIMSFVEFDPNTFKVVKTKPGDVNHHPSFGWTVMAKIKRILQPNKYYKSYDLTKEYTKYNVSGPEVSTKEDPKFAVSNVTSSAGAIPKVAKVTVREQIDFAGIEMKVNETPANRSPNIPTGGTAYVPVSTLYNLMDMRDGDRGGLYETAEDKKRVKDLVDKIKKEGFEYKGSDALYVDIDADGYGWIGEGNHRVLAARQLGMSHLPVRVEFGQARDGKSTYSDRWSRVPTQVVSKEKISELKDKAGPYYHIKYASIWETDLPTNKEPVAREQIDFEGSEFLNEFSWTEEVFEDGKIKKVTKTEKSDKPIAIRFPDGVVAVVRSRKDELAAAEQMVIDVKKGMYPYMDIDQAEDKRDRIRRAIKDKDVVIELVDGDMKYHKGTGYGRSAMPIGQISLVNNHYDYYFPEVAKLLGKDYKEGLMYSPDDTRAGDAVYIYDEFQGKGFGSRLYFSALRLLREQYPGARLISNHDFNVKKKAKNFWRSQVNNGLAKVIANTATEKEIAEVGPEVLKQLKDIGMEYTGDIYELLDPAESTAPSKQYDVVSEEVIKEQIDWQSSEFGKDKVNGTIITRSQFLQQAVQDLLEGKITNKEYKETAKIVSEIDPIAKFFLPASNKDMQNALGKGKSKKLNIQLEDGEYVGLRLDIPAYVNNNIWVVTAHKGTGAPLTYGSVAWATDVKFGTNPKVAAFIAAGKNMDLVGRYSIEEVVEDGKTVYKFLDTKTGKYYAEKGVDVTKNSYNEAGRYRADRLEKQDKSTIGKMLGKWKNFEGKTKEEKDASAVKKVEEIVKIENSYPGAGRKGSPWRQIGMNPFRHSYFYDRRNGKPVIAAAEVVQIGGLVYAKDVEYADWSDDQFNVNGYYDADGQPVRFQLDSDESAKVEKKAYKALEKGEISAPLYKETWYQATYKALFRTELEKEILKLQEKKEGRISKIEEDAREVAKRIKKYAKTPEALKLANEYLTSENKKDAKEAILKLPKGQQLLNSLRTARAFVDNISNELINDPAFDGLPDELRLAIQDNLTTYIRTQYRFFTDKGYNIDKRRNPAIQAQFDQLVAQEIALLSVSGLSDLDIQTEIARRRDDIKAEAEQMIDGYISDLKDVKYQPSKGGAGIKMPNAPFRRKKDLPDYIQQLLGKEKDPAKKFSQTTQALANVLYKGKMIDGIIDLIGKDSNYILEEEPKSPKDKQYTKVNDPYSKLNGKWVHNEIMDMVNQKSLYASDNPFGKAYFTTLKIARKSKVIWNITTWRKNLTGGWYFILANGVANPQFAKDFARRTNLMFRKTGEGKTIGVGKFKYTFEVDEETKRLMNIMADKGVSGKNIDANLIGVSQAAFQFALDGDESSYYDRVKRVLNNIVNKDKWLQEKYSAVDDYTKLIIFRSEIQTYAKKLYGKEYSELNESQQDNVHEEAAERVKQSTPTFSRLPKWFNKVAGVPVVGDFISFRLESLRSYGMNVANGVSDIKKSQDSGLNDVQKKAYLQAGLRRLAGSGAVFALKLAIVKVLTQLFLGDDDELEEDIKVLRPEWMKGQSIIPRSIDSEGNARVYNYSSEDPYGDVSDIFGGPESWGSMVSDFIRPNIAADLIFNLSKGQDIYGGKIADYSDSKVNQLLDALEYTAKQIIVPPTISSSFRDAWLKSELPKKDRAINLASTIAERSIIRDYSYNVINSLYQDVIKISETRKSYLDYKNPAKRLRQLDEIGRQYDAIVAIAVAKDNYDLIRKAERAINKLDEYDRDYIYENIIIKE